MQEVALIDADGHNYPNLPLMKLSAFHKQQGNLVEWYEPTTAILRGITGLYESEKRHI